MASHDKTWSSIACARNKWPNLTLHISTFHETTREATVTGDSVAIRTPVPECGIFANTVFFQFAGSHACGDCHGSRGDRMLKHHEANNAITVLSLGGNTIGDAGAIQLANGLKARHVMCAFTHAPFLASDTLIVVPGRLRPEEDAFMCASRSVCFEVRLLCEPRVAK